jgi:hypothetical protein
MPRLISLLAALSLGAAAFAQTPTSPAAQQVQLLAPQLLAFAGSGANFESLVNGLTQGTPVTLTAAGADGSVQTATFVPGTTVSVLDAARLLESARQSLITRGIAAPDAQQLAIALMGGTLPTAIGATHRARGAAGARRGRYDEPHGRQSPGAARRPCAEHAGHAGRPERRRHLRRARPAAERSRDQPGVAACQHRARAAGRARSDRRAAAHRAARRHARYRSG